MNNITNRLSKIVLMICLTFFFGVNATVVGNGQINYQSNDPLLVVPTKFKSQATNITYEGETCSPRVGTKEIPLDSSELIKVGDEVYYQADRLFSTGLGDGLVRENVRDKTCRVYRMYGLAEAAGWFKSSERKYGTPPNATAGLFRVGDTLWMGTNGIGVAVFDLKSNSWSRYDLKLKTDSGKIAWVIYADDDYVFISAYAEHPVSSFHVYSVKQNKWLGLEAVSTKLVREFGYESGLAQVPVDHRDYAKAKYFPLECSQITLSEDRKSYLFEVHFSTSKTAYEIRKSQLEQVFVKKKLAQKNSKL